MHIPQVAIVGRPNVGKSSIFNWLYGRRLAIVDDIAGVTRDRLVQLIERDGYRFELIDTGGIGIDDADDLTAQVEAQIQIAIDSADVLLFVVDVRAGATSLDAKVAARLRKANLPIVLAANKTDDKVHDPLAAEFHTLGVGSPVLISTKQNRGRNEILAAIDGSLPKTASDSTTGAPAEPVMKLAIVGRRNAGKSTFINTLLKTERMITSEVPGTTRDSVDVRFELDGKSFIGIDTPGIKRIKSVKQDIEFYGLHRAKRSIRYADISLIFFDASHDIGKVDKQLVQYVSQQEKPCVFVVNKWDLRAGEIATEEWADYVRDVFPTMKHVPIAFITGKTGKNVKKLLNHAQMIFKQAHQRVSTGELNRFVGEALMRNPPPVYRNRRPKVYYSTQADEQPPTIVLFCNEPRGFSAAYQRYLVNFLRERLKFAEVPIRLQFRKRGPQAASRSAQAISGK